MRILIWITKESTITFICLLIGCMCLGYGMFSYEKYKEAIPLESINVQDCEEGAYVTGRIHNYVAKNVDSLNNEQYSGVSRTLLTLRKEYYFYTIPTRSDTYIQVMVSDRTTIRKLEAFVRGEGEGVYFEGEIRKAPVEVNYKWYEGTDVNSIVPNLVIKEAPLRERIRMIYPGITFLLLAVFRFLYYGGIKNIVTKEYD